MITSQLVVHTSYGDHLFKVPTGHLQVLTGEDSMAIAWVREVIEEGVEPYEAQTELYEFHSWRSISYPDAEGLVEIQVPPEPEPRPVGYDTVFVPFGDPGNIKQTLGSDYVLLHKDHAGVVGPEKQKGSIYTKLEPFDKDEGLGIIPQVAYHMASYYLDKPIEELTDEEKKAAFQMYSIAMISEGSA